MLKVITSFIFLVFMTGCAIRSPNSFFQSGHSVTSVSEVFVQERRTFYDHTEPTAERWLEDGTVNEIQRLQVRKIKIQECRDACRR